MIQYSIECGDGKDEPPLKGWDAVERVSSYRKDEPPLKVWDAMERVSSYGNRTN